MIAQKHIGVDLIGLCTVPVIFKNVNRSLTVNALLDDASTKTYINADVAAEQVLKWKTENEIVNVLNGQNETFETRPVNLELQSVNGNVSIKVSACTTNRVMGSMTVVDWYKYKEHGHIWKMLMSSKTNSRHPHWYRPRRFALCTWRGKMETKWSGRETETPRMDMHRQPWTYIRSCMQTNFACTYFVRDVSEIARLKENLKNFWEIDSVSTTQDQPVIRIEEQLAVKR